MAQRRRNKPKRSGPRSGPRPNDRTNPRSRGRSKKTAPSGGGNPRSRGVRVGGKPSAKKKGKAVTFDESPLDHLTKDPMKKLYAAHPRHVIKLILKKLCEKPSFYRMLGTLGVALKSGGVDLATFFLSAKNKVPKSLGNRLRYDLNDGRMLILCRLAVHKMLIREGTTLKSYIPSAGTFGEEYDSDDDDPEIQDLPPPQAQLKRALKLIPNDQFVDKMHTEDPQGL